MTATRLDPARVIAFLALVAIMAAAFVSRLDLLVIKGGLNADQLEWAVHNYYGGSTQGYLSIRDAILSWTPELHPWPYPPGYPLFLAILHAVGVKDLSFVRLVQIVTDTLAILPLYFVLHRLGRSVYPALAGCLIYAVAPWWSVGSTYLLGESLSPALVILLLAAMLLIRDHAEKGSHWLLLGLLSAILPFFRSDMLLLFGPLAIWALLVAPERRRFISAAWVIAGFAIPILLWAGRNYYIHHQFALTPPAKWYNAWAGLGQVANDFGYFVNDERAGKLLASKGIRWNSFESESYWFKQYIEAWISHPGHVLRTIFYRFGQIVQRPETWSYAPPRLVLDAYLAMAFITPIALIWLLRARKWPEAFLIALPTLYALGSLGPLYVEPRYVRYAGLTYLLVLPIVLGKGKDSLVEAWGRRLPLAGPPYLKSVVSAISLAALAAGAVLQLAWLTRDAQRQGFVDRLAIDNSKPATSRLGSIAFRPEIPAVEFSQDQTGLHLQARTPSGRYLLTAAVGAQTDGAAIVRYRVTLQQGAIGLGILTADTARWLSYKVVYGKLGQEIEGTLSSIVEPGSRFVIAAQGADGEVNAVASKLEWVLICPKSFGLLSLLLAKTTIPASECSSRGAEPS